MKTAPSAVRISTVYTLLMRTIIYVQMHNVPDTVKVMADEVDDQQDFLIFKVGGKKIGQFSKLAIAGWWIQQGDELRG